MAIGQMPNWVQFHIKVKLPYRFKNSFLFVFEWVLIRLNIWKRGEKRVKAIGAYGDTGTLEQSMQLLVFCLLHPSSPSSYTCKPTNTEEERKKTKNPRKTNLCCTTSLHKKNSDNFQLKENVSIEKILLNQQSFIYRARTNTEQCFDEADQATPDQTMPGFIFKTE